MTSMIYAALVAAAAALAAGCAATESEEPVTAADSELSARGVAPGIAVASGRCTHASGGRTDAARNASIFFKIVEGPLGPAVRVSAPWRRLGDQTPSSGFFLAQHEDIPLIANGSGKVVFSMDEQGADRPQAPWAAPHTYPLRRRYQYEVTIGEGRATFALHADYTTYENPRTFEHVEDCSFVASGVALRLDPGAAPVVSGVYPEMNARIANTNLCVDVAGNNSADGAPLQLWTCHGQPNQRWVIGDTGQVRGLATKCMGEQDRTRDSRAVIRPCQDARNVEVSFSMNNLSVPGPNGEALCLANEGWTVGPDALRDCADTESGITQFSPWGELRIVRGGGTSNDRCLEARADGEVVLAICNPGDRQRWVYTAAGELRGSGGKCMQAASSTRAALAPCTGEANQTLALRGKLRLTRTGGLPASTTLMPSATRLGDGTPLVFSGAYAKHDIELTP